MSVSKRFRTSLCAAGASLMAMLVFPVLAGPPQVMPGAGGRGAGASASGSTHGWFVAIDVDGSAVLEHVPPRRRAGPDGLLHGAPDGVLSKANVPLEALPRALAAWDDRVYLVFDPAGATNEEAGRMVASVAARPTPLRDQWRFDPVGRLTTEPSLPGDGELEGFAASEVGLGAMLTSTDRSGIPHRRLFVLDTQGWHDAPLPVELAIPEGLTPTILLSTRRGLGVLRRMHDGTAELWEASNPPEKVPIADVSSPESGAGLQPSAEAAPSGPAPLALVWTRTGLCADGSVPWVTPRTGVVFESGGRVFVARALNPDRVEVVELTAGGSTRVGELDGVGSPVYLVGLDTPSRLFAAWIARATPATPGSQGTENARLEVRELSLVDGRVEYGGPGSEVPPLSSRDVQWLAVGLVVLMGVVLMVVLRADPKGDAFTIPRGMSLAPSGRRIVAGVVDLAAAAIISARSWGFSAEDLGDPAFVLSEQSLLFVGTVVGVGFVLGVVGETLMGRSIGKIVTVCEVIDVRVIDSVARPQLWQAVVRNLVKWILSPAALVGLMDPEGRHRGDGLARTAVVIPEEDDPELDESDE